ncbi:hypothetical protein [Citricoccus sp. I39-566]|uniref:hypothetical protein n=1 Tax=Citricoccus sp. I39-566 TaxID=3073268 RepID=UPI00286C77EF|nr:hypothetical protein [Citricoccus sp. I39-566]WMY78810.1 hypothetical protein RE421_02760 [Citricoccus sp. I39-566]
MATLTRRYIDQVVAHVPDGQREDLSRELDALTSDMLQERLASGAEEVTAEREVLEELGDPARLAARYREAPNHLIGPEVFPLYTRLLRWVLVLVLLLSLLANVIAYSATVPDGHLGGMIGQAVGEAVVALFVAFGAVTGFFAVFERVVPSPDRGRAGRSAARQWSVEDLEVEVVNARDARSEAISSLVFLGIVALVPLVPTTFLYVGHLNGGGSFVNQALWDFWLPAYYVLILLGIAQSVWTLVRGRVTRAQVVARAMLDVVAAVFFTVLVLTQQVLDPAIDSGILQTSRGADWVDVLYVAVIWLVALWDLYVCVKYWRTLRSQDALITT